jgi:hypothetical protein
MPTAPFLADAPLVQKTIFKGIVFFCITNYLIHLFPISIIDLLGLYPQPIKERLATGDSALLRELLPRASAWLELAIGIVIQLGLAAVFYAFAFTKDIVARLTGISKTTQISLLAHFSAWILFYASATPLAGFLFQNSHFLANTRADGAPPILLLTMAAFGAFGTLVITYALVVSPDAMSRELAKSFKERFKQSWP